MGELVVTGAAGRLGRTVVQHLRAEGRSHRAFGREALDITKAAHIREAIGEGVDAVINCAAFADVERAESEQARANAVNGDAVALLCARCEEVGARLVHYSTEYVFDGEQRTPYTTQAPRRPINAYGRSKVRGEDALLGSDGPHLLLRTSWVYSPWGRSFVRTIARLASQQDTLHVVDDQRARPSSGEQVARVTCALLNAGVSGTFHVTDAGECSRFELAQAVVARVAPHCRVVPCASDRFASPARRPTYGVLDITTTEAIVGPLRPWQDGVADLLDRL